MKPLKYEVRNNICRPLYSLTRNIITPSVYSLITNQTIRTISNVYNIRTIIQNSINNKTK